MKTNDPVRWSDQACVPSYNEAMSNSFSGRRHKPDTKYARRLETIGLIIVAVLILAITITRSWHHINWSAR